MTKEFNNKTVLVTGGANGIGKAIARRFAAAGAKIIIFDIQKPTYQAEYFPVNVASENEIAAAFKKIKKLDILVNDAGIYVSGSLTKLTGHDIDRIFDVNLKGTILMCKYALPLLKKSRGQIINISSMLAFQPKAANFLYPMTKAGLVLLTEALAQDYPTTHVRVNAVLPGPIAGTKLHGRNLLSKKEMAREIKKRNIPLGRFGEPEEVADIVAYICSKKASYIHGSLVTIDGGRTAAAHAAPY